MVFKPILTRAEIRKIVTEFKSLARWEGIAIDRALLFGSYAKGRPHPWSDIDLCVVTKGRGRNDYDDMVRLVRIAKRTNYLLEVHPIHSHDLRAGIHPLATEIKKTGRVI